MNFHRQFANAHGSILVTVDGIVICLRDVQFRKLLQAMVRMPSWSVTLVRLVHPLKVSVSMLVTVGGISIDFREVQEAKAWL